MRLEKTDVCRSTKKKRDNEQFGRKMKQDVEGNRKLFWKEVSKMKGEKVESCSKIKDRNDWVALREDEVRRILKDYFEDLYNIDIQEQVAVHMCGFDGIRRSNSSVESRLGGLK